MKCYACGKTLRTVRTAYTADDDQAAQPVGPDCHQLIRAAGDGGYQPPSGGPRLYFQRWRAKAADDLVKHVFGPEVKRG